MSDNNETTADPQILSVNDGEREKEQRGKLALIVGIIYFIFVLIAVFLSIYFGKGTLFERSIEVADASPPIYMFSFYGQPDVPLEEPIGLAVGPSGRVYVVDSNFRNIQVFNKDGKWLFNFGKDEKKLPKGLQTPLYISVDDKEQIYVTDRTLGKVFIFNAKGEFVDEWRPFNKKNVTWCPLAVEAKGKDIYFSDTCFQKVSRYDNSNKKHDEKLRFGGEGAAQGQFAFPNGITVSATGDIYVADSNNSRVQVFNRKGEAINQIVMGGLPRGVVIDKKNYLLVVDAIGHIVYGYDLFGGPLFTFGELGEGDGQFNFPNDIDVNEDGRIYVTDRVNKRIQVWEYR